MIAAKITAFGSNVPDKRIDNQYFESFLETSEEWIVSRTGIRSRHWATEEEFTSNLAVRAVRDMVARYHVDLRDVDMILVSTVSPDQPMPSMACMLQYRLEIPNCGALDVFAACAGFAYAITVAKGLIAAGTHKKIIVVGAETLSKVTDYSDRTSCILFGDGAGVMLIEAAQPGETGCIGACATGSFGEGGPDLYMSGMAQKLFDLPIVRNQKIIQNGKKVFKWAVTTVAQEVPRLLAKEGLTVADIDWFVPHSANLRIIEAIANQLSIPMEKVLESVTVYGNTSSASIPLAFDRALKAGKIKKGDKIVFFGFGGGLVYAGNVITWNIE
jgi:3-oxoacyl-[acyl-carrier-protein] synthase III